MSKDNQNIINPKHLSEFRERKYVSARKAGFSVRASIEIAEQATKRMFKGVYEVDPDQIDMFGSNFRSVAK